MVFEARREYKYSSGARASGRMQELREWKSVENRGACLEDFPPQSGGSLNYINNGKASCPQENM